MTPVNRLTPKQARVLRASVVQERREVCKERKRYLTFGFSVGAATGSIAGALLGQNASLVALGCVFVAPWQLQELPKGTK